MYRQVQNAEFESITIATEHSIHACLCLFVYDKCIDDVLQMCDMHAQLIERLGPAQQPLVTEHRA